MAKKVEKTKKEIKNENMSKQEKKIENNTPPTPPKKKSKLWILIVVICVLVLGVGAVVTYFVTDGFDFSNSSSSKSDTKDKDKKDSKEDNDNSKDNNDTNNEKIEENKNEVFLDTIDFIEQSNGNFVVKAINPENNPDGTTKYYLYDKDLKFVSEIKDYDKYSWKDGYALVRDTSSDASYVLNFKGEKVWEDKNGDYLYVALMSNGHLVLSRQNDTFNTSEKQSGIYDLNLKKMVLDFDAKYYMNYFEENGDDAIGISDKSIFNTRTNQLITYEYSHGYNFINGYATNTDYDDNYNNVLGIFADTGGRKTVLLPEDIYIYCKNHRNGICFDNAYVYDYDNSKSISYSYIVNLKAATIKELGNDYHVIDNKVLFNKHGYALLIFENAGSVQYYTVIDTNGNRMFEPVRVNDNTTKLVISKNSEISESNYYMVSEDGRNLVVNYKNEIAAKPQNGETFDRLIGNYILVKNNGKTYLKDLKGKKVNIAIEK